jgi:hypothetical protein
MKKLVPTTSLEYSENVCRIADVCKANGYEVTHSHAQRIWLDYSERMAAGWMSLPTDDEMLLEIVLTYSTVVSN